MLKKLTSILLVAMLLAALTPNVIYAASATEEIASFASADTRAGAYSNNPQSSGRLIVRGDSGDNLRQAYISFDLTGYESKIMASSEIKLDLYCTRYTGEEAKNFNVYLLPAGKAKYVNSDLTYNIAVANNMSTGGTLVASNSTLMSQYSHFYSDDMSSALKSAIKTCADSKIVFRIDGTDTAAQSFISSGHKLSLTYDDESVDDQGYIEGAADNMKWSDISDLPQDSISGDISLPSKLYGANVTWSSNDSAISSDGKITPSAVSKDVILTAQLNYNGATASKSFTVTVLPSQATDINLGMKDKAQTRGGGFGNKVTAISFGENYTRKNGLNDDNDRYIYISFDLSGYEEEVMKSENATFSIDAQTGGQTFEIALLPTTGYDWSSQTLTYNISNTLGMMGSAYKLATGVKATSKYTTPDFASTLKTVLASNPTNSVITLRLYGEVSGDVVTLKYPTPKLNLSYCSSDIDKEAFLNDIKDELVWSNITDQPINSVTDDLVLPSKFYGFNVSWASDNSSVINPSTGKVTSSKTGEKAVNLTATISNGTFSCDKTFTVTVSGAKQKDLEFNVKDKVQTRGGTYGNNVTTVSYGENYTRKEEIYNDNDRYIFVSFDLSGYEEEAMKSENATFSIDGQTGGQTFEIALLPTTGYDWSSQNLTYNRSNALGMMDSAYTVATGVKATSKYTTPDFASTLKTVLASNPTSSVITFRIHGEVKSDVVTLKYPTPKLNIGYYSSDIDSEAFFNDVKDDLSWDDITTQPIDSVIADLKLPSKLYGFDVSWESNDAAIGNDGSVSVGEQEKAVTLSYTVTDGTTSYDGTFDVTVSDKNYELDFSNSSGSGAKIYSSSETDASLAFAAYRDGQLISLSIINVAVADGENIVHSLINTTDADEIKIMLVADMSSLTPLCGFKCK